MDYGGSGRNGAVKGAAKLMAEISDSTERTQQLQSIKIKLMQIEQEI